MMLPSSVRRVVSVAPQSSSLLSGFAPATAARATAAAAFSSTRNPRCQQRRRYSSSKPSNPSDSPKGLPDGQITTAPAQSAKTSGEKRGRRKAKDAAATGLGDLPSVPSTQHVPMKAVALSSFFSLHRPMSVTQDCPKTVSDDAFAQIFASRTKGNKPSDVMATISRTIDDLEQPQNDFNQPTQNEANDANMHKIDVRNADGSESSMYVQLNAMSGQFLPFRPPPLPQPESAVPSVETGAPEAVEEAAPQHRVYKAIFTLEETTDTNGEVRILAHSPTLIEEEDFTPRTFLERMALRQARREERNGRPEGMVAISVKRQRKLKMKKKKYKKLMKRTRNDRRKLDRI
ncbi:uncharacterized protein BCR38DRAFT_449950 [Pseudomassariella vexata]|uniref:Small ribosomal subunit protein mS38 n=1 Tax=Pseudomassariella vexata TaxID=1141098 RepID=A0A1Y2DDE8_9PEZI|nr:uncharacterized protein BCR38DRAFT_449950 [Pseudomassariella vexata]ORY57227.1 hypothetical protein BCR38DRAFT_449950 [Pseudomassariella vexata]